MFFGVSASLCDLCGHQRQEFLNVLPIFLVHVSGTDGLDPWKVEAILPKNEMINIDRNTTVPCIQH